MPLAGWKAELYELGVEVLDTVVRKQVDRDLSPYEGEEHNIFITDQKLALEQQEDDVTQIESVAEVDTLTWTITYRSVQVCACKLDSDLMQSDMSRSAWTSSFLHSAAVCLKSSCHSAIVWTCSLHAVSSTLRRKSGTSCGTPRNFQESSRASTWSDTG